MADICEREFDFTLGLNLSEISEQEVDALYEAGCSDATPSVQFGRVWMDFSRVAKSYKDAVFSAIRDIRKAKIGADVTRIDECNLVTQAEIARKIGKSPQYIHQLMTGSRGPGGFPPPSCHLGESAFVWEWCEVSHWLVENNIVKREAVEDSRVAYLINEVLALRQLHHCEPDTDAVRKLKEEFEQLVDS